MKEIILTEGFVALVDDEDYGYVARFTWRVDKRKNTNYAIRHVCLPGRPKTTQRMHRLILGLGDPSVDVDHLNKNGLDNRKENLRMCGRTQHIAHHRTKDQYLGVYKIEGGHGWEVRAKFGQKQIHLGPFQSKEDAARAYDKEAAAEFGELAVVNLPESLEKYSAGGVITISTENGVNA